MLYKIFGRVIPLKDLAVRYGHSGTRIASQMNDVVFEWLDKNYSNPFFLFINYFDPHNPFAAPSPYDLLYEGKDKEIIKNPNKDQKEVNYCVREGDFIQSVLSGKHNLSEKEKEHFISQYDGKISYLDFQMGKLFQRLKELEIYDQTMIIVAGDHGESFGEHHLMFHNLALYDTLLKVPLIIKYPLSMKRVGTIDYLVSLVDVLPEILSSLGIPVPDTVQGSPLRDKERKGVVAENYRQKYFVKLSPLRFDRDLRTIIKGGFKYIWTSDGRNELYNLSKDPGELKNLVNELPQKGEEMQTALNNWLNSAKVTAPEREIQIMDERIKENLKVLGYID
jgi:arylsulfatase A-like enzyme